MINKYQKISFSIISIVVIVVITSFWYIQVNPFSVLMAFPAFARFFGNNFLPPNFIGIVSNLPTIIDTIFMAIFSTFISAILAIVLGILMSKMNPFKWLRTVTRFIVSFLRNIPLLVWITLLIYIFGIGHMVGVVALVFASLGFLARSYAESINEISATRLEAIRSSGASWLQIIFHGLMPEFLPAWINWTLFSFEINIRASAVLGWVGAGGLGFLIQMNMELRSFSRAFGLIVVLIIIVLITEAIVNILRKRIYPLPTIVGIIVLFVISAYRLDLDFSRFISRLTNAPNIIRLFFTFNFSALPDVLRQLLISITIGICGLVIGFVLSIILAFLAANNITPFKPLSWLIKGVIAIIRAIPSIVLILMVVASLGLGNIAGVAGLMFSTLGYLTKAFITTIEEQNYTIIEAKRATGASWIQIVVHGLLPNVWKSFVSWISIRLEANIADSISIGIVGAGGIGMLIDRFNRENNFPSLSTTIVVIFLAMLLLECCTQKARK